MPFKKLDITDEERKARRKASYRKWKLKPGYKWERKFPLKARAASKLAWARKGEKIKQKRREFTKIHPGHSTAATYRWRAKNPDYVRQYGLKNKERIAENRRKRCKQRKQEDPGYRALLALRRRIATALERAKTKKTLNTKPLLGCDIYSFILYIESLLETGMNWSNHGSAWHLDHVIPCAVFDLSNDDHKRYCFHFSNYQPLWAKPNLSKGKKLPDNFNLNQHLSTPLPEATTPTPYGNKAITLNSATLSSAIEGN